MALKLHVLVSFAHLSGDLRAWPLDEWNVMLDSGAFTNFTAGRDVVTLDDYIAFVRDHREAFWQVINLDRIGDPVASMSNLAAMEAAGLTPVPVFQRGDTAASLDRMLAGYPLVAIGGISQSLQATAEQEYLRSVLARTKKHPVHLLGVGHAELVKYRPYSGDNSTWTSARQYGHFRAWYQGRRFRISKLWRDRDADHKDYIRPDPMRTKVLASYGVTWADLRDPVAWSGTGKVALMDVRSWMRMARWLMRSDCRYVFAIGAGHLDVMREAWAMERASWGWT